MTSNSSNQQGEAAIEDSLGGTTAPPLATLSLDYVYDAISHPKRRYLCYTLLEQTEWCLQGLATKIAAWEQDIPEHAVPDAQREMVYVSLYHAHIPKLVDDGVITFDEESETIRPGETAIQVLAALGGAGGSLDSLLETHARGEMDAYK